MAEFPFVTFSNNETHRLADLSGVLHDLRATSAICAQLRRLMAEDPEKYNLLEIEALQAAAVIRYCRTYCGGVRTAFKLSREMLDKLPTELQEAHREFDALRDKHIAHSVNDWELNVPVIYLKVDATRQTYEVSSVSVQNHRIVALAEASIRQLHELAQTLGAMVENEIDKEKARVLEIAKAMPIEELKKGLHEPAIVPGIGPREDRRAR